MLTHTKELPCPHWTDPHPTDPPLSCQSQSVGSLWPHPQAQFSWVGSPCCQSASQNSHQFPKLPSAVTWVRLVQCGLGFKLDQTVQCRFLWQHLWVAASVLTEPLGCVGSSNSTIDNHHRSCSWVSTMSRHPLYSEQERLVPYQHLDWGPWVFPMKIPLFLLWSVLHLSTSESKHWEIVQFRIEYHHVTQSRGSYQPYCLLHNSSEWVTLNFRGKKVESTTNGDTLRHSLIMQSHYFTHHASKSLLCIFTLHCVHS